MVKRIVLGVTVGMLTLMPLPAEPVTLTSAPHGFNDKMLILHNGVPTCVDWKAWPGHMLRHGDTLLGTGSCDVPKTGR